MLLMHFVFLCCAVNALAHSPIKLIYTVLSLGAILSGDPATTPDLLYIDYELSPVDCRSKALSKRINNPGTPFYLPPGAVSYLWPRKDLGIIRVWEFYL